jgi:predicted RNA-binding protein with PIN domain
MFRLKKRHGTTASGANETQASKSLFAAQKGIGSRNAPGVGQAQGKKITDRGGIGRHARSCETQNRPWREDFSSMPERARYLIVDGHSIIFAWPELRKLHERRSSLAREALTKRLRDYQDWTGVSVVVVFDGKAPKITAISEPGDVQIFYSRGGQTADTIIERLASKYADRFDLMVATSDSMERETVHASGAQWISPEVLHELLERAS